MTNDTVRLKNTSDVDLLVYGVGTVVDGDAVDGVDHEAIAETPGRVLEETDDYYLIGSPDDLDNARAWPKAHWTVTRDARTSGGRAGSRTSTTDSEE